MKDIQGLTSITENLAQLCFAASSFRRVLNDTIVDIQGNKDGLIQLQEANNNPRTIPHDVADPHAWKEGRRIRRENGFYFMLKCSDLIVRCMWAEQLIPCEEVISQLRTENGFCCEFNMMPATVMRSSL